MTDAADVQSNALSGILNKIEPGKDVEAFEKSEKTSFRPFRAKSLKRNLKESAVNASPIPGAELGFDTPDSAFPRTKRLIASSISIAP
jgi:hypothetical protein